MSDKEFKKKSLHQDLLVDLMGYLHPSLDSYSTFIQLLGAYLPPAEVERAKTDITAAFDALTRKGRLGVGNYDTLIRLVERVDVIMVTRIQQCGYELDVIDGTSMPNERAMETDSIPVTGTSNVWEELPSKDNLAVLFDVTATNLNRETTALGINLDLTQNEIDQIRQDNPQSAHEQNFQIIWRWYKSSAKRTDHIDEIKKQLAEMERNDVIKLLDEFDLKKFDYKCTLDGDEILTEKDCLVIAQKIGIDVFKLLRFFGQDQHTLERIRSDFHGDLWEQALRMLTEWRKSTFPNCTRNKLCSGLTYMKREDIIHFLEEQKWCKK